MSLRSYRVPPTESTGLCNRLAYDASRGVFAGVLRSYNRLSTAGVRPVPDRGPVILAPNHRSYLDPLVLGTVVTRRVYFIMSAKYYDMPLLNWFFRMARCIPVEDETDNRSVLRGAKQVLDAGHVLGIFPEGHISPDGSQQRGQQGVAWLARKTGAPVVPIHIAGSREALTKGDWRLRPAAIAARSGASLSMTDFPAGRAGTEQFTDVLMDEIARLGTLHQET